VGHPVYIYIYIVRRKK